MRHLRILITFLLLCTSAYPYSSIKSKEDILKDPGHNSKEILHKADSFFNSKNYAKALEFYEVLATNHTDNESSALKKIALCYSALNDVDNSVLYIEEYLKLNFDTTILSDTNLDPIRDSIQFKTLSKKYKLNFSFLTLMYLYVALIGFYIAIIINFNNKIDNVAKVLISGFVFIHSVFILHIFLSLTHLHYQFPHSYRISTSFSFLYGPLLYLYFKRITCNYQLKKIDILHFLPTLILFIVILPSYTISGTEKLNEMITRTVSGRNIIDLGIIVFKLVSLVLYGFFIHRLYYNSKNNKELNTRNQSWQKYIYSIHIAYIACYTAYGFLLGNEITSGFLYHLQIVLMASMVMYIGYSANIQPSVFNGTFNLNKRLFFKYKKSGLTKSLSQELKEHLLELFDNKKIYRESDLNLKRLAVLLNTTTHNTSQVINEHFKMNFHELVNQYRINEAKHIFEIDHRKNLNIIDVAYEVGYNNKVTFNKAFKKDTQLTPSEYQREMHNALYQVSK